MKKLLLTFIVLANLAVPTALAQNLPTILPGDDINVGGAGDECVGLATMIQTGDIHLRNLPCFIKYISQTLVALAGTLAVIFVMIGGYRYVIGSDDQKDVAKKTITYALIGLVVTLLAWVIIDLVLQITTD